MSWITSIAQGIETAFSKVRPALATIPTLLLICEIKNRPGLSAMALATAIITRLPEAGISTATNPDGTPNKIMQFVRIISEEFVKEVKNNLKISSVIMPGSVSVSITGMSPSGPVTGTGVNIMPTQVDGLGG